MTTEQERLLLRDTIEAGFRQAAFVGDVGIALADCGPGWCESTLAITARHLQHGGIVHAGVQATMADHTAGAAASTILEAGQHVVTAEFKINLLRAVRSERLRCRADVLKSGRSIIVVEADVFADVHGESVLVSRLNATMSVLDLA
ncbi:PaaI family thioesterase [Cupriavidus taiwanensis]|uniref:Medium/long-chain acyl-CoA thioesterase YigI n=1 Tax=Cupriavidus taiwanensis TaxID=164546 RepID=A0A7Z7NKL6_9BURK|nr:PaaI family thioesterase [Cupriavidus taiwanensis]SOY85072.1 Phenylacetic acid degradation protein PaaI [Cupriavidus taiwanensis]SOY99719.1 Phenylacetic acid degradation protein PaaI [Cupriavidus taiwanensis]SOZ02764.1 Phenylacetic acid degradation protein PaaI [Cupriavidus taiwanensis]SPC06131.1 Phenylacetic acid degradation protein PaaI [Cupriavidus taiwanensis]SPD42566.1 Phenylacetic acid degradation protein PaaI [Cupriavidus taiwanensis]